MFLYTPFTGIFLLCELRLMNVHKGEENEALLAAPEEQQGSGPPTLDDGLDDIVSK